MNLLARIRLPVLSRHLLGIVLAALAQATLAAEAWTVARTSQISSPSNGRFAFRDGGMDYFEKWLAQGHGAFDFL